MKNKGTLKTCPLYEPDKENEEMNNWSHIEYRSKLQSILDTINEGCALFSNRLELIMCNQSFKRLVKEITGKLPGNEFDVLNLIESSVHGNNGNVSGYPGVGSNITEQKGLQEKLIRQKVERQKEITRATITGEEKERNELGRELHDNINQILAATKLQLECHLDSKKGRPDCIINSHEYLSQAMKEIRNLSKRLVSPRFQDNKLPDEIGFVISNLGLDHKTIIDANQFPEEEIPEEIRLTIFRIVQEQLNNIFKYAHANSITISLAADENGVNLVIKDDGAGFDTTQKRTGIGLSNIQARAELYNGCAKIISTPGKGCCLQVFLPLKKEEA